MQKNSFSEKYNIFLIIFFFVIPLLGLNFGFYFFADINDYFKRNDQEKTAIHEAELLGVEADFNVHFLGHFRKFFDVVKSDSGISSIKQNLFITHLDQNAEKIFEAPFPKYGLYVFKLDKTAKTTDLLYSKGDIKGGKKGFSLAFDYLYNASLEEEDRDVNYKKNESFVKNLLGQYTRRESIARELRGNAVNINYNNKFSLFVWDYFEIENYVFGSILIAEELEKHSEYGRLLALKNLKSRGIAIGAFLPIYKEYGKAIMHHPLDKSRIFTSWAESMTIQDENKLETWLQKSLPQRISLGNYTAFCHLERGASYIAVVLVKAISEIVWPKWLIFTNILLILILCLILFYGICFGYWPNINLTVRFALMYILAAILPLSLLFVASYGYFVQFKMTSEDQAVSKLQSVLKSIDSEKTAILREYREAFIKALNDEEMIKLIKGKGINDIKVVKRVLDIFEGDKKNKLPVLGIKIMDEAGNGAFIKGGKSSGVDADTIIRAYLSALVNILRRKIEDEYPDAKKWMKEYVIKNDNQDLANRGFQTVTGQSLEQVMNKHLSTPFSRRTGDIFSYQIFDFIKIDNKSRYILCVVWDDKALDESIVQNAFSNYTLNNLDYNFTWFRNKSQNDDSNENKTRHASKELYAEIKNIAREVSLQNKSIKDTKYDNIIFAMPSLNFSQVVFVGWIDKANIDKNNNVFLRKIILIFLVIISLIILWLCTIRSASVFLKPVSALKGALDEVSRGNLNVSLNNPPNDELGKLSNEFSRMIDGLREKERLSKLISDQAVQALQKHSNELMNDTERFNGVALVSDIRNFTGMSEEYDPIFITDLLNEHFAEMAKIISDNGGLIYKFIGDAIEAVFPEKDEYEESASERAFKAGCMMIAKLAVINKRRTDKNMFTYRIGVGLCYGTMFSGSVGSLETRLDYAILGEPLKKAAKFEALSIQNPLFPLVVGIDIAENLAKSGFSFYKIDNKGQDFIVYSLEVDKNEDKFKKLGLLQTEAASSKTESEKSDSVKDVKIFSLQALKGGLISNNSMGLTWFVVFIISIIITLASNFIYHNTFENLRIDSNKECLRLIDQLNSNEVLKSSFEALCFNLYEDLYKTVNSEKKELNCRESIEMLFNKYKRLKKAIPNYCCLFFNPDNSSKTPDVIYDGFSPETSRFMADYAFALINDKKDKQLDAIEQILGKDTDLFTLRSIYNRRSALATIDKKDVYLDTERFYDKSLNNLKAFVFCAMPQEMPNDTLVDYYKILSGDSILLAFNCRDEWSFSENFSDYEKQYLRENYKNEDLLNEKGYLKREIIIGDKTWNIFLIKKELALYYRSWLWFSCVVFVSSIMFFIFFSLIIKKLFIPSADSVSSKLKINILTLTILPLFVVALVSYLYVNEDYNNNKSDARLKLNNLIDEVENKELYYQPYCLNFLDKVSNSEDIKKYAEKINSCENDKTKKILVKDLNDYLEKNVAGKRKREEEGFNPFFSINEIIISGRKDWTSSIRKAEWVEVTDQDTSLSEMGKFISTIGKALYIKNNESLKNAVNNDVSDNLIDILASIFGGDFTNKFINLPKNLVLLNASFATVGFYISSMPSSNNPDFVLQALIFINNELKPRICNLKNDEGISLKEHYATGSKDNKSFCFFAPNISVGEYFFYYRSYLPNRREELRTVKELGLAASWINSSFVPVSRTVNLYGPHFLEARKGNIIADNVYVAITSEIPIREKANNYLLIFGSIIFFSIIMIYCIAENVTSDLLAPINSLMDGAKSVAKGDYSLRINYMRKDELGVLCESFNKMVKSLEEKQLMNRMVSKTALKVSANVADVDSKKINVALLYVTVPSFDKIMKNTSVYELFTELRKQVATIAEIVIGNGGDIDKIMGEKLLIAFHIGDKSPKDTAVLACKVANMIERSDKISYKVSVGVNYGQVISGFLGVGEKRDFTIIGDPVNVAARIAVLGEKLDKDNCLISETIYSFINVSVKANLYGKVELKGKSEPMKVYQLL